MNEINQAHFVDVLIHLEDEYNASKSTANFRDKQIGAASAVRL